MATLEESKLKFIRSLNRSFRNIKDYVDSYSSKEDIISNNRFILLDSRLSNALDDCLSNDVDVSEFMEKYDSFMVQLKEVAGSEIERNKLEDPEVVGVLVYDEGNISGNYSNPLSPSNREGKIKLSPRLPGSKLEDEGYRFGWREDF